jgi:hypothetical protein
MKKGLRNRIKAFFKTILVVLFSFLFCQSPVFSQVIEQGTQQPLKFELIYDNFDQISLKSATLHVSPDKLLGKTDSAILYFLPKNLFLDTLYLDYPWKVPVHAWIEFDFSDKTRISNKFFVDPFRGSWVININDTGAIVKAKPKISFADKESYMGMILIFQIILELVLASLLVRFFRWPAWVILVVLVSNLATYPIFQLKLQPGYLADLAMLLIKFIVIFLTGRKRLGIVRIITLVITLSLISYGFRELFIVIYKVL